MHSDPHSPHGYKEFFYFDPGKRKIMPHFSRAWYRYSSSDGLLRTFMEISYISLCFLSKPIPFGALDKENVDTLIFIFPRSERRFLRIESKAIEAS